MDLKVLLNSKNLLLRPACIAVYDHTCDAPEGILPLPSSLNTDT